MLNFQFVWICIYREQASVHTEGCRADLVGIEEEMVGMFGMFSTTRHSSPQAFLFLKCWGQKQKYVPGKTL